MAPSAHHRQNAVSPKKVNRENPARERIVQKKTAQGRAFEGDWIFAYGSLMWDETFPWAARVRTRLYGYHRGLCVYSWVYRGTEAAPGLVLGLDHGGSCQGLALKLPAEGRARILADVLAREQVRGVYHAREVRLAGPGGPLTALTFVADRDHAQYAGRMGEAETLKLVRDGTGISGRCEDYVRETHRHLQAIGIQDRALDRLITALDAPPG